MRLAQLKVNVTRLRALAANLAPRYVVANIPAARIEAIENGAAVSRHTAVAGKPDRPSPDINSKIVEINFNPYWTVPASIVKKDLIPKMQETPDYLSSNHIRIFNVKHQELRRPTSIGTRRMRPITAFARTRAASIRSARSASIFPTPTRSICTTRR